MIKCNLTQLLSITPNEYDFPIQILTLFLKDTPKCIENAKISFKNNEIDNVYKNIHKIKPSMIMIGLPEESLELVLKINEYIKNNVNLELLEELLNQLSIDLNEVYIYLEPELERLKNIYSYN